MGLRLAAIATTASTLAASTLVALAPAPAVASMRAWSGGPRADALLAAPPRHASAGVCYAHVRRAARYAPPPGPRAFWRLSPPPPGAPGPVWCLVVQSDATPAVLLEAEREGWIRVACARRVPIRHYAVRHYALRHYALRLGPARKSACGCRQGLRVASALGLARPGAPWIPPPPPPVVIFPAPNPAAAYGRPGPHILSWGGKTAY